MIIYDYEFLGIGCFFVLVIVGLIHSYIQHNYNYLKLNKFLKFYYIGPRYYLDLTDEIQLLFIYVCEYDYNNYFRDFVPIIKATRYLCFEVDLYYVKKFPLEKIKTDIENTEDRFNYVIRNFIELYEIITNYENPDFEETIKDYNQKCKEFNIIQDLHFLDKKDFVKKLEKIHSLRNYKYEDKRKRYIYKESNIPILFNHNRGRIFGDILFYNIKQPDYTATYVMHHGEIKLIDKLKQNY